mmetsp:Transcript_19122/g.33242  ORF Transcript_19122/g.33242 Transcript_19122/m.33242 type:complete len:117 (-) Transcript_19122:132-482(-)
MVEGSAPRCNMQSKTKRLKLDATTAGEIEDMLELIPSLGEESATASEEDRNANPVALNANEVLQPADMIWEELAQAVDDSCQLNNCRENQVVQPIMQSSMILPCDDFEVADVFPVY